MDSELSELGVAFAIGIAEQAIMDGEIEIDCRTDEEIALELLKMLKQSVTEETSFEVRLDKTISLATEADRFRMLGNFELAIVLAATQIEHWLNSMVIWGCERHHGMNREDSKAVVRGSVNGCEHIIRHTVLGRWVKNDFVWRVHIGGYVAGYIHDKGSALPTP